MNSEMEHRAIEVLKAFEPEDGYRYPKRLFNKNLFFSREAAEKALEDA